VSIKIVTEETGNHFVTNERRNEMNEYFVNGNVSGMFAEEKIRDIGDSNLPSVIQKKTKPQIDDVICQYLDGNTLKDALYIINNIREHEMKIKWASYNVWKVQYKRKHVCDLKIDKGSLHIGQVSGVLAIRVTNMSYDRESLNRMIEALRDSIAGSHDPIPAMQ